MGIIKPTLTLTANSNAVTTDPGPMSISLALSVTDSLTVDIVEQNLYTLGVGSSGFTTLVDGSAVASAFVGGTDGCFVYMKNTMASTVTEKIYISIAIQGQAAAATDGGTTDMARSDAATFRTFTLNPGEFAFFPHDYAGDIIACASAAGQVLEFWRYDR